MLIWFTLFFLVVAISFVLALRSMGDYQELPWSSSASYTLYLVQNPHLVTTEILTDLHEKLISQNWLISFERLARGPKSALVIYGPEPVLHPLKDTLRLLELEDYSLKASQTDQNKTIWEMGVKNTQSLKLTSNTEQPKLGEKEELWWQLVLSPQKQSNFKTVIRALVISDSHTHSQALKDEQVKNLAQFGLAVLPEPYSLDQLIKFYQQRSMPKSHEVAADLILDPAQVRLLLSLS